MAIIYFEKGVNLEPDRIENIQFYCDLADCYNSISNDAYAITNYTNCLKLYYGKYYKYIEEVIKDSVEKYVDEATKYCFYGSMATRNISRLYYKYFAFDKAIPGYKMIWDLEPMQKYKQIVDFVYLSDALFYSEDSISANSIINEGLEKFPKNPDLLFLKALHNSGDYIRNIELYTDIIKQEKNYIPVRFDYATAYNNLAWAYCCVGNYDNGLPYALKSVQEDSTHDYSWETLGEIYFYLGRYQDCIDAMTKCIELSPNYKSAYEFRGNAKIKLAKTEDGEKDLQTADTLIGD